MVGWQSYNKTVDFYAENPAGRFGSVRFGSCRFQNFLKTIDFRAKKWPKHLGRVKSELTRKIKKSKKSNLLGFLSQK